MLNLRGSIFSLDRHIWLVITVSVWRNKDNLEEQLSVFHHLK